MKNNVLLILLAMFAIACAESQDSRTASVVSDPAAESIHAMAETAPSRTSGANDPALLINHDQADASLVLAATGEGGIEVYGLDGRNRKRSAEFIYRRSTEFRNWRARNDTYRRERYGNR